MNSALVTCPICHGAGRFMSHAAVRSIYNGGLPAKPRCDPCDGIGMIDLGDAPATVSALLARTLPPRSRSQVVDAPSPNCRCLPSPKPPRRS